MLGLIYIITNDINNKIYIGQTTQSLEDRLKGHNRDAHIIDYETCDYRYNHKFSRAIRKYGIEHFKISLLEECDVSELNQKEIEYIAKYDSYNTGYNSTLGGEGTSTVIVSDEDIKLIVSDYNNGKTIRELSERLELSKKVVTKILKYNKVKIRHEINEAKQIVMYDKYFNPVKVFNSKKDIVKWIKEDTDYAVNLHSIYGLITKACKNGNIAYGHRWQLVIDLICDNKLFRSRFDKEAYIQGKKAYQPEGKKYYVVDGAVDSIKNKEYRCIDCGKPIGHTSKRCVECYRKYIGVNKDKNIKIKRVYKKRNLPPEFCKNCGKTITKQSTTGLCNSCANVQAKGKSPKPSKEELESLLKQGIQKKQIAEQYNRSTGTVDYWIESYGLLEYKNNIKEHKQIDKSGVTCVELNIHFNTFKEAAEYMINNKFLDATDIRTSAYRISQAKQNNKVYIGFTWR